MGRIVASRPKVAAVQRTNGVCFGSLTDIGQPIRDVRIAPRSRRSLARSESLILNSRCRGPQGRSLHDLKRMPVIGRSWAIALRENIRGCLGLLVEIVVGLQ